MEKTCVVCNMTKSLDAFYDHPTTADRKEKQCKACKKQSQRDYYQIPAVRKRKHAHYLENKDQIAKKRQIKPPSKAKLAKRKQRDYNKNQPPIPFRFSPKEIDLVESFKEKKGLKSFSAGFKQMISNSLRDKSYLNYDAFTGAVLTLESNAFQLYHLKNNLQQILTAYQTGRIPGFKDLVVDLKEAIEHCSNVNIDLAETRRFLLINKP